MVVEIFFFHRLGHIIWLTCEKEFGALLAQCEYLTHTTLGGREIAQFLVARGGHSSVKGLIRSPLTRRFQNGHFRGRFRSSFQWCEFRIWATKR
jgi:hypothetical protein